MAAELRERLRQSGEFDPALIGTLSDEEVIDRVVTCSCCDEKLLEGEALAEAIERARDTDDFLPTRHQHDENREEDGEEAAEAAFPDFDRYAGKEIMIPLFPGEDGHFRTFNGICRGAGPLTGQEEEWEEPIVVSTAEGTHFRLVLGTMEVAVPQFIIDGEFFFYPIISIGPMAAKVDPATGELLSSPAENAEAEETLEQHTAMQEEGLEEAAEAETTIFARDAGKQGLPPRWPELEAKLLAHGGKRVVWRGDEAHLEQLLERGRLWQGAATRRVPGVPNECHSNCVVEYLVSRGALDIVTGYALNGGIWRQHSWLWDGARVLETTVCNESYFGVLLPPAPAAHFVLLGLTGFLPGMAKMFGWLKQEAQREERERSVTEPPTA